MKKKTTGAEEKKEDVSGCFHNINKGMNYEYINYLYKSYPDLYSILWHIFTLSRSNKSYTIELDHRECVILTRFIDKLLKGGQYK